MSSDDCEWPGCGDASTHRVTIHVEGEPIAVRALCRSHDRQIKVDTVRSRPKPPPAKPEQRPPGTVACANGHDLDEPSNLAISDRRPCPICQSIGRTIGKQLEDTLSVHSSVETKKKPSGGPWTVSAKGGGDYTRDLEAWGTRELLKDRERDLYREVIVLWDGTRITSESRLSDHRG